MDQPLRHPSRPAIVRAGIFLLAIAAGAVGLALYQLRMDALADARRDVSNLALVLSEQTKRAVETIDYVLRDFQDDIAAGPNTAEAFAQFAGSDAIHRELAQKTARLPYVDLFAIVDATGLLVNVSRIPRRNGVDLADRDFYRHFRAHADTGLFISAPTENKTTGTRSIYLARRVTSRDGQFLGVVLGGVALRYFEDLYRSFDLPRRESLTLARRDGLILVRHRNANPTTQSIPADAAWDDVVSREGARYASAGRFDDASSSVAVQPVRGYPLVMSAAVANAEVLGTWYRQALTMGAGALLILTYAGYLMRVSSRQFDRLKNSRTTLREQNASLMKMSAELQDSRADLQDKTREAKTILETMDQGLMMVDRGGVVVHCNSRARALLDLPAEFVAQRPTFQQVLTYQWMTNLSGHEEGSFEDFAARRGATDRPDTWEIRRPDGRVIEVRSTPVPIGGFVRTYTDITSRKGAEEKVHYLAHHDDLTSLPNRIAFRQCLNDMLARAQAQCSSATLLYLDLDGFKEVNDTYGHEIGDRVLMEAAQRMRSCVRAGDTVARLGGDEFAVALPFLDDLNDVTQLAERLVTAVAAPFAIREVTARIGVSVGIAIYPFDGGTMEELSLYADKALYAAKAAGRNTYRFSVRQKPARAASG